MQATNAGVRRPGYEATADSEQITDYLCYSMAWYGSVRIVAMWFLGYYLAGQHQGIVLGGHGSQAS